MSSSMTHLLLVFVQSATALTFAAGPHVRALDPWASQSLERGVEVSATIRGFIRTLDALNVIVHVESSTAMPPGIVGMTRLVRVVADVRYLRVTVHRDVPPDVRAATLAHELQHAIEVSAANVNTHAEMQQLYERVGHRVRGTRFYETRAAEQAGARAWRELRGYVTVADQD
jgi:hypothetical protein